MTPQELIDKVKELKKKRRVTQGKFASLVDVDVKYIAYIENGNVSDVPMNVLTKIEYAIDCLEDM